MCLWDCEVAGWTRDRLPRTVRVLTSSVLLRRRPPASFAYYRCAEPRALWRLAQGFPMFSSGELPKAPGLSKKPQGPGQPDIDSWNRLLNTFRGESALLLASASNGGYPTESGHTSWDRGVITGSPPLCAESRGPAAERASYWRCETTSWHYGRRCPQPSARLTPAGPHRRCTRRLTRGEITARGRGWWRCPWPGTAPRLAPAGSRNRPQRVGP
jgi:hypothetical protein